MVHTLRSPGTATTDEFEDTVPLDAVSTHRVEGQEQ